MEKVVSSSLAPGTGLEWTRAGCPFPGTSYHSAGWLAVPTPQPQHTELLLAEGQLLAVAGQGCLLSGTTNHHELILKGPGQLQKVHLLVHTEVETLEIAKSVGQEKMGGLSKHFLAFLRAGRAQVHTVL